MRKGLLVTAVCVLVILLAGGALYLVQSVRWAPVTLDDLHKIRKGMTLAQVEQILGRPSRIQDFSREDCRMAVCGPGNKVSLVRYTLTQQWKVDDDCCIQVSFGEDGTVVAASQSPGLAEEEKGPLERVRDWLAGNGETEDF
jgi:hypothetical protein